MEWILTLGADGEVKRYMANYQRIYPYGPASPPPLLCNSAHGVVSQIQGLRTQPEFAFHGHIHFSSLRIVPKPDLFFCSPGYFYSTSYHHTYPAHHHGLQRARQSGGCIRGHSFASFTLQSLPAVWIRISIDPCLKPSLTPAFTRGYSPGLHNILSSDWAEGRSIYVGMMRYCQHQISMCRYAQGAGTVAKCSCNV